MPRPVAQPAALTSAPTPDRSFTPSLVQSPPQHLAAGTTGSLAELATFMEKQQLMMKEQQQLLLEQQKEAKEEVERAKQEMDAKLEAKIEEQRQRMQELMAPQEAVSDQQVEAVTARLQAVHAAQLLSDDELFAVEDGIADFLEVKAACGVVTPMIVNTQDAAGKVHKLVVLSRGMVDDAMFARQVRRKFV